MNNTVTALQNLYVKLGGSLTDTYEDIADGIAVSNYVVIPDMLDAISQLTIGGGGASLPAVTSADDGDVLTVVDGAWAKAEATKELPETTAEDEGSTLAVVNGAWGKKSNNFTQTDQIVIENTSDNIPINVNDTSDEILIAINAEMDSTSGGYGLKKGNDYLVATSPSGDTVTNVIQMRKIAENLYMVIANDSYGNSKIIQADTLANLSLAAMAISFTGGTITVYEK